MTLNLPGRVRGVIYVVSMVGTPLVAYLASKGIIGDLEVTLWSAEVAVAFAIARLNLSEVKNGKN